MKLYANIATKRCGKTENFRDETGGINMNNDELKKEIACLGKEIEKSINTQADIYAKMVKIIEIEELGGWHRGRFEMLAEVMEETARRIFSNYDEAVGQFVSLIDKLAKRACLTEMAAIKLLADQAIKHYNLVDVMMMYAAYLKIKKRGEKR